LSEKATLRTAIKLKIATLVNCLKMIIFYMLIFYYLARCYYQCLTNNRHVKTTSDNPICNVDVEELLFLYHLIMINKLIVVCFHLSYDFSPQIQIYFKNEKDDVIV